MQQPAWMLIVIGLMLVAGGLAWLLLPSIPWMGKLPGDIAVQRENVQFYFPITSCILLSVLFSAIMWLIQRFSK